MKITIEQADGLNMLPAARNLRQAVFVEEQGFKQEFDETDQLARHVLIRADGVPAATGRAFPGASAGIYTIGRVAVAKPLRGAGLGRVVMEELERYIRAQGGVMVELMAQEQARGFYASLGYQPTGETCMDEHCPHVMMRKAL